MLRYVQMACHEHGRAAEFAKSHGWMLLSICSNSKTFRALCNNIDQDLWTNINATITKDFLSIEMFAKTRALEWRRALKLSAANDKADVRHNDSHLQ